MAAKTLSCLPRPIARIRQATPADHRPYCGHAKPCALKTFDKLLTNHGVALENDTALGDANKDANEEEHEKVLSRRFALGYPKESDKQAKSTDSTSPADGKPDVEFILVDAPKATITACLAEIKNDASNYVGVEVGETDRGTDHAVALKSVERIEKTVTDDWSQFNRGAVTALNTAQKSEPLR